MVTPKLLKVMKEGGCWSISYGIESGSQEILDLIKNKITIKQIKDAVYWTKENGIKCVGFFMVGHPCENKKSMAQTLILIKELPLDEFHMTFFTPHPGTEVYSVVDRYGSFYEDWNQLSEWNPVFIPDGLTKEDLVRYSKKAFFAFYMRPRIIFSYIKKIKSWMHLKT
ncbi:MAG: radical SAM protein [Deltaproteobacteria bacterium]|nr:radical SAM protein [Deltaproteobacteria bacterium]